jgi:hypothetical protein
MSIAITINRFKGLMIGVFLGLITNVAYSQSCETYPYQPLSDEIIFEEIDCEADKGKAALYKIVGYPTFKLSTIDKIFIMKGTPDPLTFDIFLKGTLGEKSST